MAAKITVTEAARRLKISRQRVYQIIAEGGLVAVDEQVGPYCLKMLWAADVRAYQPAPEGYPKGRKRKKVAS